jgi:hypothetical protein
MDPNTPFTGPHHQHIYRTNNSLANTAKLACSIAATYSKQISKATLSSDQ